MQIRHANIDDIDLASFYFDFNLMLAFYDARSNWLL